MNRKEMLIIAAIVGGAIYLKRRKKAAVDAAVKSLATVLSIKPPGELANSR